MTDLTYAYAIGPGRHATQAKWLVQSIQANTAASTEDIVTYVVESERDQIDEDKLSFFQRHSVIIEGEMPNPDYPLSAAHGALVAATDYSDNRYTVLLDTDTVVLDDITVHQDSDAELLLVPEPVSAHFWADLEQSENEWANIYNEYEISIPNREQTSIHGDPMPVIYNGGMILVANNTDFPQRWLDVSRDVFRTLQEATYYTEMVSLALLSNEYKSKNLPEVYNYLAKVHLRPPPNDVKILHYPEQMSLYRALRNPTVEKRLAETDVKQYFDELPVHERTISLMASYLKAYELSHPTSPVTKMISALIELQLKIQKMKTS